MNCLILINIYIYIHIDNNNAQFYEHSNAEQ